MKDVASCEKLRVAAKQALSGDVRMGKPGRGNALSSRAEFIGARRRTRGVETSSYPQEKKATAIPSVAASESGTAQTPRM